MSNLVELGPIFHTLWHMFPVRLIISGVLGPVECNKLKIKKNSTLATKTLSIEVKIMIKNDQNDKNAQKFGNNDCFGKSTQSFLLVHTVVS